MTFGMILRTVFEFALVSFTLWGVFHEDRFVAFEHRLIAAVRRRRLKVVARPTSVGTALHER